MKRLVILTFTFGPAVNPNSEILTEAHESLGADLQKFHSIMTAIESSSGKNVSSMIQTVLTKSSLENPLPLILNEDKIKQAIDKEKRVVYSDQTKEEINGLLEIFSKKLGVISVRAQKTGKPFEVNALSFCLTIIDMYRSVDVESFQKGKADVFDAFIAYIETSRKEKSTAQLEPVEA